MLICRIKRGKIRRKYLLFFFPPFTFGKLFLSLNISEVKPSGLQNLREKISSSNIKLYEVKKSAEERYYKLTAYNEM